jgi:hypothetical protein
MKIYLPSYNPPEPDDRDERLDPPEDETEIARECRERVERDADLRYLARLDAIKRGSE